MISWGNNCKPKEAGGLGIRKNEDMNKALLSKLRCRMTKKHDYLWVKLIKGKYDSDLLPDPSNRTVGRGSHIWKGIQCGWELFQRGSYWRVRNGKKVRFWQDVWLDNLPLKNNALANLDGSMLNDTVYVYWSEETGWNWQVLGSLLPNSILLKLASTTLSSNISDGDLLGWRGTTTWVSEICPLDRSWLGYPTKLEGVEVYLETEGPREGKGFCLDDSA